MLRPVVLPLAWVYRLKYTVHLPAAFRAVRAAHGSDDVESHVRTALDGCGGIISPIQFRSEITAFIRYVRDEVRPRRVLEIGTAKGGTLFLLCRAALPDATVVSVDLPGGHFGGGYPAWRSPLYRAFAAPGQHIHLLRADSHREETANRVRDILGGEPLDLLFIDGDHTYEGVRSDFERYRQMVRTGGAVAFHDIVPNAVDPDCGVPRFWREVRDKLADPREFVESWDQPGRGIGMGRL